MEQWVRERADVYLRHGGKISRRRQLKRLILILKDIQQHEKINQPSQIGKAHIHRYYNRHLKLTTRTLNDHYYALAFLWTLLNRSGTPPKPAIQVNQVGSRPQMAQ